MNIKVWDDKYAIKSDAYSYVVAEIKTKQDKDLPDDAEIIEGDGDTYEINLAYLRDFSGCYRYIVEREGRKNKCTTMEGYVKHIEKLNKKLSEEVQRLAELFDVEKQLDKAVAKKG
jgi:hypothetical protein